MFLNGAGIQTCSPPIFPDNAFLERQGLVGDKIGDKLLYLLSLLPGVLQVALEVIGLGKVRIDSLCRLDEEVIEFGPGPLLHDKSASNIYN